jgi:ABC-2 type transport system ATP-binding protein
MLHNPQILYLDEPTIGLDVIAKDKIRNFILEANKQRNITVVLSTRDVIEIERLCSRVLVINNGQLVYNGNLRRMKDLYSSIQTIQVEVAQRLPDIQDLAIIKYVIDNKFIKITYDNNIINSSEILNHILKQCQIKSIKTFEPKIDDVIRNMYEKFKY